MAIFDDRERAEEAKFAHDEERLFRARALRDRKLGIWIGQTFLGHDSSSAEAYAQSLVGLDLEKKGDENLVIAVLARVNANAERLTENQLRRQLDIFMADALTELSG
jgi:hypothetical protein